MGIVEFSKKSGFKFPKPIFTILKEVIFSPIRLFPDFPYLLFYTTSIGALLLTLLISPFTSRIFRDDVFSHVDPIAMDRLINIFRTPFFDPVLYELIALCFATYLVRVIIKSIEKEEDKKKKKATFFAYLFPWLIFGISLLIVEFIFKPSFGYSRPIGYSENNETFFVYLFRRFINVQESAPSGSVVRQLVCALTLILLNSNKFSPIHKKKVYEIIFYSITILSVLIVAFQRLIINSHSLFDIIFSLGCGVIIFWLVYVIPYDIHNVNTAVEKVMSMNMLFVTTFYFYSNNPTHWLVYSLGLMAVLFALDKGLVAVRKSRTHKATNNLKPQNS
jgi:hypothetical protein